MPAILDDLLNAAQGAYARGDLHAAAAAWRRVLDVQPEHGAARDRLSAVEAEIENSLDDAFEILVDAQQTLGEAAGSAETGADMAGDDGGAGLTLPESEVELAEMADLEAYDTGELPTITPLATRAPTPPAVDGEPSAHRSGSWELAREDTNPGAIVPGFGGTPAEAPPRRSTRPSGGVLAADGEDAEEVLQADEEALDAFFSDFEAPDFGPPEMAAPTPQAPTRSVTFDPPSAPLLEATQEDILPPVLQAVPDLPLEPTEVSEAESRADTPDAELVLQPLDELGGPDAIEADPSSDMVIDAMPEGPRPSPESFPEFVAAVPGREEAIRSQTPAASPAPSAPVSPAPLAADRRTLSGVITRKRSVASKSVVEGTRSWSRVDLFSGTADGESRGDTLEFTSGPDDVPTGGLAAAVAAFQQGDPVGAYDVVLAVIAKETDNAGAADFRDRIAAECERALLTRIGPVDAVPSLAVSAAGLTGLDLDHKAGFILAQIEGFVSFEDVVDLSGMDRLATLRILVKLLDASVITR